MLSLSGVVAAVEGQFRKTDDASDGEDDGEADRTQQDAPRAALFQCPDCESVYVAVDKGRCETCETAVEQVPSTLSRTR